MGVDGSDVPDLDIVNDRGFAADAKTEQADDQSLLPAV